MNRGRPGKEPTQKKKLHPVYATDAQWDHVRQLAKQANADDVGPFIMQTLLNIPLNERN